MWTIFLWDMRKVYHMEQTQRKLLTCVRLNSTKINGPLIWMAAIDLQIIIMKKGCLFMLTGSQKSLDPCASKTEKWKLQKVRNWKHVIITTWNTLVIKNCNVKGLSEYGKLFTIWWQIKWLHDNVYNMVYFLYIYILIYTWIWKMLRAYAWEVVSFLRSI